MNALGWTALVGGGALAAAYALLKDKRQDEPGSAEPTRAADDEPLGQDLATLARLANRQLGTPSAPAGAVSPSAGPAPAPPAPTPQAERPAPPSRPKHRPVLRGPKNTPGPATGSGSRRPERAPMAAWNRRADDGGPAIHIGDDVEALARVITNEAGDGAMDERVAIGWIARNLAARRGQSIARVYCWPCGARGPARPFSTRDPASAANRELAAIILASPPGDDPTRGATAALDPRHQDQLARATFTAGGFDARAVRRRWLRTSDYYGTVGRFDLFGPKGGPGAKPVPRAWALDAPERGIPASELE
jgi:hypothetical protein